MCCGHVCAVRRSAAPWGGRLPSPLRFGRVSPERLHTPPVRQGCEARRSRSEAHARHEPLPDQAAEHVITCCSASPVLKTFESMLFEFGGQRCAPVSSSRQGNEDKMLLQVPCVAEGEAWDPLLSSPLLCRCMTGWAHEISISLSDGKWT